MSHVSTTQGSIPFGTVLHATVEAYNANDFKSALPHVPKLAKVFGDEFPRITWNADREGLKTWQSDMRRFVNPYFSEGLDIISSLLETTITNDSEAQLLMAVNCIDPVDVMIAGHLNLFSHSSYDRFSAIYPTDVAFHFEEGTISVVNPLTHDVSDLPVFDEPSCAISSYGDMSDQWNSWFEKGMESPETIMTDDFLRKTPLRPLR